MKLTKIMLCAAIAGTMAFAASKASAFPLQLKSFNGKLSVTPSYSALSTNSSNVKITTKSFSLKDVLLVVSNQVSLNTSESTNPVVVPKTAVIMFDPYTFVAYLTNNLGFYYNLSGIVSVSIYDIATSFKGNSNSGSENDTINIELDVFGYGPDGKYFEAESSGAGTLKANINKNGVVNMTLSESKGAGYGEFQSSDDGVTSGGKFSFQGSGTVTAGQAPYSLWWY